MSIWGRLLGRKSAGGSDGDGYTALLSAILASGGGPSKSGAVVNRETALRVGAVFACLRVLADGVAQVPFKLMRSNSSSVSRHGQSQDAPDHALYDVLHRRPNSWQTSFEFREQMIFHAALCGTAHAFKSFTVVGGKVRYAELILVDPSRVKCTQNEDFSITYQVRGAKSGEILEFPQSAFWSIRGPSWNGVVGLDILNIAREAIGLSISTEESHAKLHANGVRTSGAWSTDATLDGKQYQQLKDFIAREFSGSQNAGAPMIIDRGAKWVSNVMNGVDAQHLETRLQQISDVCRFFRVLPLMVGHSDKTQTFASAEQMFLAHVVHTLMPWYERIQQSADVNLLSTEERQAGYYTKLNEAGLLRGAMKDTAEYLTRLTMAGIMERNEARSKLDLNPLDGLDDPLTPTNMTTDPSGAVAAPAGA